MAQATVNLKLSYESATDVMHIDFPTSDAPIGRVDAVQIGFLLGMEGLVILRVGDNGEPLGLTVSRFSRVKRTLIWKYRRLSWRKALNLLVDAIRAGASVREDVLHSC